MLPDSLHINAKIEPEVRYRGVYEIVVYETSIKMEGYFKDFGQSKWENWGVKESNILWNEAVLEFSVGDPKGINSQIQLDWNGKPLDFVHGQSLRWPPCFPAPLLPCLLILNNKKKRTETRWCISF